MLNREARRRPPSNGRVRNPIKRVRSGEEMAEGRRDEEEREARHGTKRIHCKRYSARDGAEGEMLRSWDRKYLRDGDDWSNQTTRIFLARSLARAKQRFFIISPAAIPIPRIRVLAGVLLGTEGVSLW